MYEHSRTEGIVTRLTAMARTLRVIVILLTVVQGAVVAGVVLGTVSSEALFIGIFIGALFGMIVGSAFAGFITVGIEWLAQMLVAQGEIVAALKNTHAPLHVVGVPARVIRETTAGDRERIAHTVASYLRLQAVHRAELPDS